MKALPDAEAPIGRLFSQVYMRTDEVLRDNKRMRFRMGKLFDDFAPEQGRKDIELGEQIESEIGIEVITSSYNSSYVLFVNVVAEVKIADLLDMITLLFRQLRNQQGANVAQQMLGRARRIFSETQVGYAIDDEGGAHPAFDAAFESVRLSAISGLGGEAYNTERHFIEAAEQALMADPIDGRQAIRSIFDAVENLFKQMYDGVTHLNSGSIGNKLKAEIEAPLADRDIARRSALKQVDAFKQWVDAAHFYRHAPGEPDPAQPPDELAILAVSQGFGFLRWLVQVRRQRG